MQRFLLAWVAQPLLMRRQRRWQMVAEVVIEAEGADVDVFEAEDSDVGALRQLRL